ncbi:fumarylacetoacetate hydrolase family protein [Cytobacillus depressus]|uniref:Fumarylacetoacetate hydrolase family protein n=1 Tax=Cytobacillus depressus TaxID=1602942 RepID=A0A6L3V5F9_9BACI|nr:fumarylacetoacetate hydrolase family protein [Cytobacillus depressus]KAB2329599.1 fumarylacetoacetate hydrolase family protein [Cytobacillus depressus]
MKLLTFEKDNELRVGVKTERGVLDVLKASLYFEQENQFTINNIIQGNDSAINKLNELVSKASEIENERLFLDEEAIKIGPCIPNPGKIICVGLNYRKHAEETNAPIPEYPILFNKFSNTVSANGDEILLPFNSSQVDYEAELVIVIGKEAKRVSIDNSLDYVFGYCAVNDLSARDLQFRTQQWLLGKTSDGFSPLGPYLVTSDEVGNPNQLYIKSYVNDEIRQDSNTSDMIFSCAEIVSYISQYMTLVPGDIILTGTPEGVILGYPPEERVWLKDGDKVTIEIEKLGKLTNIMKQEI